MRENTNVLIVEDELITAQNIAELLIDEDYYITGIAKNADTALKLCTDTENPPQVIVCDINIEGSMMGIELARKLKEMLDCEVVFLSAYSDTHTLQQAFDTEPVMYVVKPYNDIQLRVALRMAFHRVFKKQNINPKSNLNLTDRELRIAQLVADGLSSKQVANRLSISVETVKTHRKNMLQKNKISSFPRLIYLMTR